jgi:drug/metabolite transporter (DMT)-like permease
MFFACMRNIIHTLLLIGVTVIWGWTFVIVQDAIRVYGVLGFLTIRFIIAAACLAVFYAKHINLKTLKTGLGISIFLTLGYLLQTFGLRFTIPTNSGLITGLFVVFAPLADRLLFGVRTKKSSVIAIGLSIVGLALLVGESPKGFRFGDILTLGCAAAFGLQITLLSRYSRHHHTGGLALCQIIGVVLVLLVIWPVFEPVRLPPGKVWFALIITGLLASALAFYIQTMVQKYLPASRTAIILITEPVFAAFFGYWLANDRLNPVQIAGGCLILLALLVCEFLPVIIKSRKIN